MSAMIQHAGSSINQQRQAGPHARCIITDRSDHVLVCDLGLDSKVLVYLKLDGKTGEAYGQ